jgi:excisionase family DNA binding protein
MSNQEINQKQIFEPSFRYPESAKMLHVSEETLRRWVSQKKIGHYKTGGRVSFGLHHLEAARREILPAGK